MFAATLAVLHLITATAGTVHALIYKRDPRAAAAWVAVCALVPFAGAFLYFVFGINRVRTRAKQLRSGNSFLSYEHGHASRPSSEILATASRAIGHRLSAFDLHVGHTIDALRNGEAVYPAMLKAIDAAQKRIILSTYIFNHDQSGDQFVDGLAAAQQRGVDVKVLIDGVGELYSPRRISKELRKRGIPIARFLPLRLLPLNLHLNMRNHRKILVVDGQVAFAGGMNISSDHIATAKGRSVSDMHFMISGPVAADLESIAVHDWNFASGEQYELPERTATTTAGNAECRAIPDGPDDTFDRMSMVIQGAVSTAVHRIDIMTPYFLPSRELTGALLSAALRGVRIRIVLPQKNNLPYIRWASRNQYAELLEWNIEIYEQPPPFCHSKLFVVDDEYSLIGSANLDPRSLRLNFELGVEVWSRQLCTQLRAHFDETISQATQISIEAIESRSLIVRIRDSAAALFSPYL